MQPPSEPAAGAFIVGSAPGVPQDVWGLSRPAVSASEDSCGLGYCTALDNVGLQTVALVEDGPLMAHFVSDFRK